MTNIYILFFMFNPLEYEDFCIIFIYVFIYLFICVQVEYLHFIWNLSSLSIEEIGWLINLFWNVSYWISLNIKLYYIIMKW